MNIAFWSSVSGRSATSGNMLAVSTMAAVLYSIKTVLVQTDYISRPVEQVLEGKKVEYMVNEEYQFYNKKGMDELLERGKLNILNKDIIKSNIVNVRHTNINYIPSSKKIGQADEDELRIYGQILKELREDEDLYFWDVENGDSELSQTVLKNSDVIVINLSQDSDVIYSMPADELIKKKAIYLVGKYDSASKKNTNHLCKSYGINKKDMAVVPYNIHFHDSMYDGNVVPFIMKNIFSKKYEANFEFINSVYEATNLVLKKAGVLGIERRA